MALNVAHGILICVASPSCRCAQKPSALARHLGDKHKVAIELRRQVEQYVQAFPHRSYDHASVGLPRDGSRPQPILPVLDGFACRDCTTFKTRSREVARQHSNQVHKKKRVADDELFQAVRLQSWFGERRERYWVVVDNGNGNGNGNNNDNDNDDDDDDDNNDSSSDADTSDNARACDSPATSQSDAGEDEDTGEAENASSAQLMHEIEQWQTNVQERRQRALEQPRADELDPWLRYTGWNEVLTQSKHNLAKTHAFTRLPDDDETDLVCVLQAWDCVLKRCLDTLAMADQKDTMKWWASPKNEAASQHPFELHQNAKSVDKCSMVWARFLCYVLRTAPELWGEGEDETGTF